MGMTPKEQLAALLRKKVKREHLTQADVATPKPAANATPGASQYGPGSKVCWLCGCEARLRFRLKDTSALCFTCFRIGYMALVHPIIDTRTRRESDKHFLRTIYALQEESSCASRPGNARSGGDGRGGASGGGGGGALDPDGNGAAVVDISQSMFVMSPSVMRSRNGGLQSRSCSHDASTSFPPSDRAYWQCPTCTYINTNSLRMCEACGFVNPGTVKCPICGHSCPISPTPGRSTSLCKNGKPHIVWRCGECERLNTLDGDHCAECKRPRYWACAVCTALHSTSRGGDGLRYCTMCGAYNTPEDVAVGNGIIDSEEERRKMIHAQQKDSKGAGKDVVFGVNDDDTQAELRRLEEIKKNEERLKYRLDHLGVERNVQKTDGNCLFSALAHQLFGNAKLHNLVRSLIVAYMRDNEDDYSVLFEGATEWGIYLNQMREPGIWGDELCLNAAARCFCVNIHVITSDSTRWHLVFQHDQLGGSHSLLRPQNNPGGGVAGSENPSSQVSGGGSKDKDRPSENAMCLFLAYSAPVHYDDITPSPVQSIVLSDLLLPELQKMLSEESGTKPGAPSRPKLAGPHDGVASGAGGGGGSYSQSTTPTLPPGSGTSGSLGGGGGHTVVSSGTVITLNAKGSPSTVSAASVGNGVGSSSTASGVYVPVAPRTRAPPSMGASGNGSASNGVSGGGAGTHALNGSAVYNPPTSPPAQLRRSQNSNSSFERQYPM